MVKRTPDTLFFSLLIMLITALLLTGCGDDSGDGGSSGDADPSTGNGAPCSPTNLCPDGQVCVDNSVAAFCSLDCSANADECSGTASCEGIGSVSASVCESEEVQTAQAEAKPEQPKIVCATDADCEKLQAGTVCATWKGEKGCTIPCAVEDDCTLKNPISGDSLGDYATCTADEADMSRTVCVPDEACFTGSLADFQACGPQTTCGAGEEDCFGACVPAGSCGGVP